MLHVCGTRPDPRQRQARPLAVPAHFLAYRRCATFLGREILLFDDTGNQRFDLGCQSRLAAVATGAWQQCGEAPIAIELSKPRVQRVRLQSHARARALIAARMRSVPFRNCAMAS